MYFSHTAEYCNLIGQKRRRACFGERIDVFLGKKGAFDLLLHERRIPGKFGCIRSYGVETHSEQTNRQTFFFIYIDTGSDTNYSEKFSDLSLSSRIVMTSVEDYLYLGHCIVMDNYYSSPELFLNLVRRKTDAVGTVRSNRKSLPPDFRNFRLQKNKRIARYYKKVDGLKMA